MIMEIDPRKNGIHSLAEALQELAEALQDFKKFHENPDDVFALKDSILRSHHALDTLFKHILYQINPVLLIKDETNVKKVIEGYNKFFRGETTTPLYELWTVTLEGTIKRLQDLGLLRGLEEREREYFLGSVKELTQYRNKLQHIGL